jgi:hypothetical protein
MCASPAIKCADKGTSLTQVLASRRGQCMKALQLLKQVAERGNMSMLFTDAYEEVSIPAEPPPSLPNWFPWCSQKVCGTLICTFPVLLFKLRAWDLYSGLDF